MILPIINSLARIFMKPPESRKTLRKLEWAFCCISLSFIISCNKTEEKKQLPVNKLINVPSIEKYIKNLQLVSRAIFRIRKPNDETHTITILLDEKNRIRTLKIWEYEQTGDTALFRMVHFSPRGEAVYLLAYLDVIPADSSFGKVYLVNGRIINFHAFDIDLQTRRAKPSARIQNRAAFRTYLTGFLSTDAFHRHYRIPRAQLLKKMKPVYFRKPVPGDTTIVNSPLVSLRRKPDTKSALLELLQPYDHCTVTTVGKTETIGRYGNNSWYRINVKRSGTTGGWVYGAFLDAVAVEKK